MANIDKVKEKAKEEGQASAGVAQLVEPDKVPIVGRPDTGTGTSAGTGTAAAAAGTSDFERLIKAIEALAGIKTLTIQAPALQGLASTAANNYALIARELRTVFQAAPDSPSNTTTVG